MTQHTKGLILETVTILRMPPQQNRRCLWRGAFVAALCAGLAGLPDAASAQSERQGFYAGLQLGIVNATPVSSSLGSINHPTRCDVLLYPSAVSPPLHDPAYLHTVPTVASNEFDHGRGLASGFRREVNGCTRSTVQRIASFGLKNGVSAT